MDESLSSNMPSKSVNVPATSDASEAHNPPLEYPIIEEFLDCKLGNDDDLVENYTVWSPPTPDNQPMDSPIPQEIEEQYLSNSLFPVKRRKLSHSVDNPPHMAGVKRSRCAICGCDSELMSERGVVDSLPCECDFKICGDCYIGVGLCPGCKAPYIRTHNLMK